MYDYLIVGAGLFGSVFAYEATKRGRRCLVIDKRNQIGGNLYTEKRDDINIHMYGAHIFHTSSKETWDYINQFATFNNYVNSPIANYKGRLFNLPFNMNTFVGIWGSEAGTPQKARDKIESQRKSLSTPKNLEEQALSLVGNDIYEMLIKGYTEKQWGVDAKSLSPEIIKRIPLRFRFDNNYFNDRYQGIPEGGYTPIIQKMLSGCDVILGEDFNKNRDKYSCKARKTLYTGTLDSLFDNCFGELGYRSEVFEHKRIETENFQGVAVMNFTEREVPYTRIIEHKHFEYGTQPVTWISYEFPVDYKKTGEPFYPISNTENIAIYNKYLQKTHENNALFIGGRLAEYKYYDMDKTIESAIRLANGELN